MKIFSVHDVKADLYTTPFYFEATPQAYRAFQDTCSDVNHEFYKHAPDFTLMELGEFNRHDGTISLLKQPKAVINAAEFKH